VQWKTYSFWLIFYRHVVSPALCTWRLLPSTLANYDGIHVLRRVFFHITALYPDVVCVSFLITARSKLRNVLFLAVSVTFLIAFLFVNQISRKRLNRFAPNTKERRIWSLSLACVLSCLNKRILIDWLSLNVKVKGQRSRSPGTKMRYALPSPPAANEWSDLVYDALWRTRYKQSHSATDGTITLLPRGDFGVLRPVKTSFSFSFILLLASTLLSCIQHRYTE